LILSAHGHDARLERTPLNDQVHEGVGLLAYIQSRIIGSAAGGQRRIEESAFKGSTAKLSSEFLSFFCRVRYLKLRE
jgi:hypothetical protein